MIGVGVGVGGKLPVDIPFLSFWKRIREHFDAGRSDVRNVARFLSPTGRKVWNRIQDTAVAVQCARGSSAREDVELRVDETAGSD